MGGLVTGLIVFLFAALVLVVVIYVFKLIMDMISLPDQIKQIIWLIFGLILIVVLFILVMAALKSVGGGGGFNLNF